MTLFDDMVAASIRAAHIQVDTALFLWHVLCVFLLLASSLLLSEVVCINPLHRWTGVCVIGSVLTIPVAGTALLMMDPYLNPRSLSTPLSLFAITAALKSQNVMGVVCLVALALVHPLMAIYGAILWAMILLNRANVFHIVWEWAQTSAFSWRTRFKWSTATIYAFVFPICLCLFSIAPRLPSPAPAYHDALLTRSYFFLKNWAWYEWFGAVAPLLLLGFFSSRRSSPASKELCRACILFGSAAIATGVLFSVSSRFESLAEVQPMRAFHPIYVIFFVLLGSFLADFVLRESIARHTFLLAPVCVLMFFLQRATFPTDQHIEWPGSRSSNSWVKAFEWIRDRTPRSAIIALDPDHMDAPGEDHQGFRAIAERSMIADYGKDAGVVTMFPGLATEWKKEVDALRGWKHFDKAKFGKLSQGYGISWVVLRKPFATDLVCPYQNDAVLVCEVEKRKDPVNLARALPNNICDQK